MFSMDFMDELESMAQTALTHDTPIEDLEIAIARWQNLFGYSRSEAAKRLEDHRAAIICQTVADSHWELVRTDKEAQGYDREAYEHSCLLISQQSRHTTTLPPTPKTPSKFLLKMEGPLNSIDAIKSTGCLAENIDIMPGTDDEGNAANFCIIDSTTKQNLLAWLSSSAPTFDPTFVRYSIADKALSSTSRFPELGLDTSLPQYRLTTTSAPPLPVQEEYPIWYFFYGTLAEPSVLRRLFVLDDNVSLDYRPARVSGGALTTWGGKYHALVDAPGSIVQGSAFLVVDKEQEDALRAYETDKYEVVRCEVEVLDDGARVRGLTFRFVPG